ncbi:MAG: ribonuclease III [Chthonomonadales bacterium]|nr:ribonuclease III [Chthonomonadales bacterium]
MRACSTNGPGDLALALHQRIGTLIYDEGLVRRALSHRSSVPSDHSESYERLEFLGDAVLGFAICEWLYRECPHLSEGEMAKRRAYLASEPVLAEAARSARLDDLIILGPTLAASGERQRASIQADVVEALIGAVYLNRGMRSARGLVRRLLRRAMRRMSLDDFDPDCKTRLQELTQSRWGGLPTYEMSPPTGLPHQPTFTAVVRMGDRVLGTGHGPSKKAAQQEAARAALATLDIEDTNNG